MKRLVSMGIYGGTELTFTVPSGTRAVLSGLLLAEGATCVTVKVSRDSVLMLDALSTPMPSLEHLYVEGPLPPPIVHADHLERYPGIAAAVEGAILPVLRICPRLRVLDFQGVRYDVDWTGLERAPRLQRLKLWAFEDLSHPIVFPPNCAVDLLGLVTWYRRDPARTADHLRRALGEEGDRRRLTWTLGFYDPGFETLKKVLV